MKHKVWKTSEQSEAHDPCHCSILSHYCTDSKLMNIHMNMYKLQRDSHGTEKVLVFSVKQLLISAT